MVVVVTLLCLLSADVEASSEPRSELIDALKPVGPLVGQWNGVAIPQDRESKRNRVFWREKSQWEWNFGDTCGLRWTIDGGKQLKGGFLTFDPKKNHFRLELERVDRGKAVFTGDAREGRLELDGPVEDGKQQRLWIWLANENRFLYSIFERDEAKTRYTRVLDAGATRDGVTFAAGASGPVCIVTGGRGTTALQYKGKTYYVCCTGCKQAFEDDPEGVIAEAKSKTEK